MDAREILDSAEKRIRECRTAEAKLQFADRDGNPLPNVRGRLILKRHEFKLGANAFRVGAISNMALQREYNERFAKLLNYATLPFYWKSYEPRKDETQEHRLEAMADWCSQNGIAAKGHPLVWHETFPDWAMAVGDAEVVVRLQRRVEEIVARFRKRIRIWDVVNEATVSHRFDNAVGRWMKKEGAAKCVAEALSWAHGANGKAALLYNDFNVSPDFEALAKALLDSHAPVHAIGIQSHMHKGVWPIEKVWNACETYARFGLPLHFTETTVLSGPLKAQDDNDWHKVRADWATTKEGEEAQKEYGAQFYTVLFSHPAVEAVTWWDFSDEASWQGAPSGLVRKDMTPKPLYEWLTDAFQKKWITGALVTSDASGHASQRCFFGEYEVHAQTESGDEVRGTFSFGRKGRRTIKVPLGA